VGVDRFAVVELRDVGHDPIDPLRPGEDSPPSRSGQARTTRARPVSARGEADEHELVAEPRLGDQEQRLTRGSLPPRPVRRA